MHLRLTIKVNQAVHVAALCFGGLLLLGCHKTPNGGSASAGQPEVAASKAPAASTAEPADKDADKDAKEPNDKGAAKAESAAGEAAEGVSLKAEEIEKMGITTTAVQATKHTPETAGFGVVVAREAIAQSVADLATAIAVERQSHSALERQQRLAGTPGAMPADAQESGVRQAAVDQAALMLAKQRLSASFGQDAPWQKKDGSVALNALASGAIKLVRVTFPLGSLGDTAPTSLRFARLNSATSGTSWKATTLWDGPADSSLPGKTFFALLKGSDVREGERLLAWAPVGSPESGVIVPASAAVISDGKYWVYSEEQPGHFVRVEIDTSMSVGEGYFLKEGLSAGAKIVTASAGQLLARETNPSTAAD